MAVGVLKIPLWFMKVTLVDFRVTLRCAMSAYIITGPIFSKETVFTTQLRAFNRKKILDSPFALPELKDTL